MSVSKTGVKAHDDLVLKVEAAHQVAVAAAANQAAVRAADLTLFRAIRDSSIANGIQPAQAITGIHENGYLA